MQKEEKRLMLAGHALNGLLACQEPDKGWQMEALAVISLHIADRVLFYSQQETLPDLKDAREPEPPSQIVTQPAIITP